MDWNLVTIFVCSGAFWMLIGVRLERRRRDAEVDAFVIPDHRLSYDDYWKKRYEDLVAEDERFMAALVKEKIDHE